MQPFPRRIQRQRRWRTTGTMRHPLAPAQSSEHASLTAVPFGDQMAAPSFTLTQLEAPIAGATSSGEQRLRLRAERAQPLVDDLESWLRLQRGRFSPKSETAIAIDYMLRRWPSFTLFLGEEKVCLTNNAAERAIRGIAMLRSLYPSSSSVWKHWNLVFRFHATRAILSRDRGDDALSLQVACPDLMRCVGYNLHVGKDPSFDCSADRMMSYA